MVFNFPFEVEHIIPLSRQGTNDEANLALAFRSCNLRKGTRTSGIAPGQMCLIFFKFLHSFGHQKLAQVLETISPDVIVFLTSYDFILEALFSAAS